MYMNSMYKITKYGCICPFITILYVASVPRPSPLRVDLRF